MIEKLDRARITYHIHENDNSVTKFQISAFVKPYYGWHEMESRVVDVYVHKHPYTDRIGNSVEVHPELVSSVTLEGAWEELPKALQRVRRKAMEVAKEFDSIADTIRTYDAIRAAERARKEVEK